MPTNDSKPKILYVDDEEENLLVFKATFRKNYQIITASSAAEGLQLLVDNPVELVISDQRMPEMSGVDFLNSLPDKPENVRMILTGYSDMEAIIEALNSGKIYKYIGKPWEKAELQKVIDQALQFQLERGKKEKQIEKVIHEKEVIDQIIESKSGLNEDAALSLQLLAAKEEINELKSQVSESNKNVQLLSEIGQEIISNLTIESIVESTYENVNALMDANSFGIGIYNDEEKRLDFNGWIEKGARLPFHYVNISDEKRPAIRCFKNKEEVVINDFKMAAMAGDAPESILYLPLVINEIPIGVISTQSFTKNAYTAYHVNILRNISIYVATALENAKSYHLIEEQKTEIEQKNVELEHKVQQRTEQLQIKNEEVQKQRDELESTYNNIKLLSEIGQKITSTLSLEKIIETVYTNVNELMDASVFGIGVYNQAENRIEFPGLIENGEKLPLTFQSMDDDYRLAVWCLKNQKEIVINDHQTEYNKYVKGVPKPSAGQHSESILYLPLTTNEGVVGVITVQSFKKHIYSLYHIDILRSLASYITIAIQNSNSYRMMTKAFDELKSAQMKLVESEKMASLGVLTAGVAHEINNPVNFISAGIETLASSYADIKALLEQYMKLTPESANKEHWPEILRLKNELEPEEALPEIEHLLNSVKTGAKRTAEIVKGLKNFTRLDENDMKKASLEEGINNTLVILNNQLKNRIEVIKEFGGMPEIMCFPGQLNQVFMNILHNAAQAIDKKGTITIKTSSDSKKLKISIKDDGAGMPENVRAHIFEPFYTTKEVGKGTGLGLSIAYGIIEKHKGNIEVISEVGKGTEFIITLPIQ